MELEVNGEQESFDADTMTVEDLLERLDIEATEGVAVAVEAEVVPSSRWGEAPVEEGDEVEIIRATQGG